MLPATVALCTAPPRPRSRAGKDAGSPGDDCYSALSAIAKGRRNEKFTFKLNYPQKRVGHTVDGESCPCCSNCCACHCVCVRARVCAGVWPVCVRMLTSTHIVAVAALDVTWTQTTDPVQTFEQVDDYRFIASNAGKFFVNQGSATAADCWLDAAKLAGVLSFAARLPLPPVRSFAP